MKSERCANLAMELTSHLIDGPKQQIWVRVPMVAGQEDINSSVHRFCGLCGELPVGDNCGTVTRSAPSSAPKVPLEGPGPCCICPGACDGCKHRIPQQICHRIHDRNGLVGRKCDTASRAKDYTALCSKCKRGWQELEAEFQDVNAEWKCAISELPDSNAESANLFHIESNVLPMSEESLRRFDSPTSSLWSNCVDGWSEDRSSEDASLENASGESDSRFIVDPKPPRDVKDDCWFVETALNAGECFNELCVCRCPNVPVCVCV